MKKEIGLFLIAGFVLVLFLAGLSLAAQENDAVVTGAEDDGTPKNMTYGQCVVAGVQIKNACYETTSQARESCITNAADDSASVKQCKADYKKDKKQCKTDFKAAKKVCIQKTKPGLWERMRYSLS